MNIIHHPASSRKKEYGKAFSAEYSFYCNSVFDPYRIQFGSLRAVNEYRISPNETLKISEFKNLEIINIPLNGSLSYTGGENNKSELQTGQLQVISAGNGILNNKFAAAGDKELHLLQLKIAPAEINNDPEIKITNLKDSLKNDFTRWIAAYPEKDEAVTSINQAACIHSGIFQGDTKATYELQNKNNVVYIFLLEGEVITENHNLKLRDALGIWNITKIDFTFAKPSQILLIEVPLN